ncbi:MAG TPA: MurR/RpiR family transcriptional regulator [Stellaceae bacterium]|nr:MurR/RpiR family transcriptional regulator [Stellaceae bacterium]
MDFAALRQRIEAQFTELSPQLRRAARFVLDRPEEIALSSMRGVAAKAGVTPSTMMRLAQDLGFPGYEAFRVPFSAWLRERELSFTERARELRERARHSETAALISAIMSADLADLQRTYTTLGEAKLGEAERMLATAPRIFIIGVRSLYPVAYFFHYACRMFLDRTILLTGQGGSFADELRRVEPGDVILAIGYEPYPHDMLRAVEFGVSRGGRVLAITDSPISPLARRAALSLVVAANGPSFFPSIVPALSIAQALVALLLAGSGDEVLERLAGSERQLCSLGVFIDSTRRE